MFVEARAGPRGEDALASPTRCRYLTIFIIADGKKTGRDKKKRNSLERFLSRRLPGHHVNRVACETSMAEEDSFGDDSKCTANEMYTLSLPVSSSLNRRPPFFFRRFFVFFCRSLKFRRLTRSFREMSRESSR